MSFGLFALITAAAVRQQRRTLAVVSSLFIVIGVALAVILVLFFLDVAPALQAGRDMARVGIKKAILKTTLLAVGFGAMYWAGGIAGLKEVRRTKP